MCFILKHVSLGRIGVEICYKMRIIILGLAPGTPAYIVKHVFLGCLGAGIFYKARVIILDPAPGALFVRVL